MSSALWWSHTVVINLNLHDTKFLAPDYDIRVKKAESVWQHIPAQLSYSMQPVTPVCCHPAGDVRGLLMSEHYIHSQSVQCHLSWRSTAGSEINQDSWRNATLQSDPNGTHILYVLASEINIVELIPSGIFFLLVYVYIHVRGVSSEEWTT